MKKTKFRRLAAMAASLLPSTEGQQAALGDVYPCFYEITYMRSR